PSLGRRPTSDQLAATARTTAGAGPSPAGADPQAFSQPLLLLDRGNIRGGTCAQRSLVRRNQSRYDRETVDGVTLCPGERAGVGEQCVSYPSVSLLASESR